MPPRRNRNRRNRGAVDPMANCVLPGKIIASILSRLPVKSLVRFKAVCKPWNTLFTNPDFISLHYNCFSLVPKTCSANSQILECKKLGLKPRRGLSEIEVSDTRPDDFFLACCKGLVCMARPVVNTDRILLWNPATRLWKILPQPTTTYKGIPKAACMGFGYNEEGDEHKVVRIYCMKGKKRKIFIEVYSSKLDRWEGVNVKGFPFRVLFVGQSTEVNGHPYWIVKDEDEKIVLLRLDVNSMLLTMLDMPEEMKDLRSTSFVNLEGFLGGVHCVKREDDWIERIDVSVFVNQDWVMRWRLGGVALRQLQVANCMEYSWRKGKLVGQLKGGGVFEYDVSEGSVRVFGLERGLTNFLQMDVFEESLVHVRGMAALDLGTAAADREDQIKECISEGFFTWLMPHVAGEIQIFYPLAF